ncbi:hypothetical protein SAMN05216436_10190 [bacterium A37T11]|nr:hypothetical protein SAMN05216436_10190 [bacterium A37T11]
MRSGFIVAALLAMACSSARHLQSSRSQQRESTSYSSVNTGLSYADTLLETLLHRGYSRQGAVLIQPSGTFSYRPDSGFTGKASLLLSYQQESSEADSLKRTGNRTVSATAAVTSDSSHTVKEQAATEQLRTAKAGPGWAWWLLGIPALVLGLAVWVWRKRFG